MLLNAYYAREDAAGPNNILTYLRGKGYSTAGERPLEAIKGALQAENNGRLLKRVANASKWKLASVDLKQINLPSKTQAAAGAKDPRPLQSPFGRKAGGAPKVAGVIFENPDGSYDLIDGYHRHADLELQNKRKGDYIILSSKPMVKPDYWGSLPLSERGWNED